MHKRFYRLIKISRMIIPFYAMSKFPTIFNGLSPLDKVRVCPNNLYKFKRNIRQKESNV